MKILYIIIFFMIIACSTTDNSSFFYIGDNKYLKLNDSLIKQFELWKFDSNGCLGYRKSFFFDKNWKLIQSCNYHEIIYLLGKPDSITYGWIEANHEQVNYEKIYSDSTIIYHYIYVKPCLKERKSNRTIGYISFLFSIRSGKCLDYEGIIFDDPK